MSISFVPFDLRVNGILAGSAVNSAACPKLSWAAHHSEKNEAQSAYRITATQEGAPCWDSGWVNSAEQTAVYCGEPLTHQSRVIWTLQLKDAQGRESAAVSEAFLNSFGDAFTAPWISAPEYQRNDTHYFTRTFSVHKPITRAVFSWCGIGLCQAIINGVRPDDSAFAPLFCGYQQTCYYQVAELTAESFSEENEIRILLADGWRNNIGHWAQDMVRNHPVPLFGKPVLTAQLDLYYADGTKESIQTDAQWQVRRAPWTSDLFDGETYDEAAAQHLSAQKPMNALLTEQPCQERLPQTVPPEREKEILPPQMIVDSPEGGFVLDFGCNISGVCRVKLPAGLPVGTEIVLRHSEILNPDMTLCTETLRSAKCVDRFIVGENTQERIWQPKFTIHGFQYVQITGLDVVTADTVSAVCIYNDIDKDSHFRCADQTVNAIYRAMVQTERDNIHSVFSDCPQRDERQGWMNDATVRFESVPYQFDTTQIFPKIIYDAVTEQSPTGEFTCTAPHFFGCRPADPVCSAVLVAAEAAYMHNGDLETVRRFYPAFKAWNEVLARHSEDHIVQYSYYGDWAGPAPACETMEIARSTVTPGLLMSTGYHYYNYKLLEKFARALGFEAEADAHARSAEAVRQAMLDKWFDAKTATVATGSQGCQAFALWLGILPEEARQAAADLMNRRVVENDYAITTGNLNTRYLFEMLTQYGYTETAWKLMKREEYPSLGFMLTHEATTIWERFEDKRGSSMNSHNHPMYAASCVWFYRHLCGIRPLKPGFSEFAVEPFYPKDLHFATASVDTVKGTVTVKWIRQEAAISLCVQVPFGCTAKIRLVDRTVTVGSGLWHFEINE